MRKNRLKAELQRVVALTRRSLCWSPALRRLLNRQNRLKADAQRAVAQTPQSHCWKVSPSGGGRSRKFA